VAIPPGFQGRLPVIAAPLFIISNPGLTIAQCKAGVIGSCPALNARPAALLDEWLARIQQELAAHDAAHPSQLSAPFAVNQIVRRSNARLEHDVGLCVKYRLPETFIDNVMQHDAAIGIDVLSPSRRRNWWRGYARNTMKPLRASRVHTPRRRSPYSAATIRRPPPDVADGSAALRGCRAAPGPGSTRTSRGSTRPPHAEHVNTGSN
jgi:hypothetical protein